MKWIGRGSLKVGNEFITYGQDIPDKVSPKTLDSLKLEGKIGDIIGPDNTETVFDDLVAENEKLSEKICLQI